jgi:hypothetical protein
MTAARRAFSRPSSSSPRTSLSSSRDLRIWADCRVASTLRRLRRTRSATSRCTSPSSRCTYSQSSCLARPGPLAVRGRSPRWRQRADPYHRSLALAMMCQVHARGALTRTTLILFRICHGQHTSATMASPPPAAVAYNTRSPGVKRILREYQDLQDDPSDEFVTAPLDVRRRAVRVCKPVWVVCIDARVRGRTTSLSGTLLSAAPARRCTRAGCITGASFSRQSTR